MKYGGIKIVFYIEQNDLRMKYLSEILTSKHYETQPFYIMPDYPFCLIVSPAKKVEQLLEIINKMPPESILIGGQNSEYVKPYSEKNNITYIEITKDEAFAVQNAVPTAEGTISLILSNTESTIQGMDIAITGYGRIGKILAPMLKALGANVHIIARNPVQRAWAMEYKTSDLQNIKKELSTCKVLVNTVPEQIIDKATLEALPPHSLILELASYPFGYNAEIAQELGHNCILASGLPSKIAPYSAAEYMADAVLRLTENFL